MANRTQKVLLSKQESEEVTLVVCIVHGAAHLCPLTAVCLACLAEEAPVSSMIKRWWNVRVPDRSGTLSDDCFQ